MLLSDSEIYYYTGDLLIHGRKQNIKTTAQILNIKHVSPGYCSVSHEVNRVFKNTLTNNLSASRLGEKVSLMVIKQNLRG